MTDIITKDEIRKELFNFISTSKHIDNNGNLKKSDITNINTWQTICNDFAGIIISKINEKMKITEEDKGDESQAQFHHLKQFVNSHGNKTTRDMFKKLIKTLKGI